ncbi:MAG: FHA domain-containing protein [Planctomycetes bacterium]|nr:FHA domain-containing protein [Planctomycetota bacterium]
MPAALKALDGYLKDRVLVLPSSGPFLVGRSLEADLTLYGPEIEDRQAMLVPDGAGHRIVPVAARASTRIDGQPLRGPRSLRDGDVIAMGGHAFAYVSTDPLGTPGAAPCAACGRAVTSGRALVLAHGAVCPRCVDRRLFAQRDLDRYRVLRKVGGNEDEITYLAVDREDQARVGLRLLKANRQADPRRVRRFLARAMVGLVIDHPNYLAVRAIAARRGIAFVVLDLHEGMKLERLARERAPIAPAAALTVINQLSEVLRHARARRLVVAKRKRTGVLVDRRLWVKVMAFDLTRDLEATAAGTAAFAELAGRCGFDPAALRAAPWPPERGEEARLGRLAPEPIEVFSLGRLLHQLVTGAALPSAEAVRAAWRRRQAGGAATGQGLDAMPGALLRLLGMLFAPTTATGRVSTLDELTAATREAMEALGAPAALEAGELELEGLDDDDDDVGP